MVDSTNLGISASYDCMINVWDLNYIDNISQLYGPHKNAILDFEWRNSLVVSGDKDGVVAFWDLNTGTHFAQMKCHAGGIGALNLYSDNVDSHLILTAGIKDGILNVFDMRTNKPLFAKRLHAGAINKVVVDMSGNSKTILKFNQ